jgi:ribonuclease BN (tRNA processing enzyme)
MRVRFWGVRGSMPIPGASTVRYGGNTSCVDIFTSDQQVIIIDAGTGVRRLGKILQEEHPERIVGTMLISHTHWDHIQGFPFFVPAFTRNNRFVVVGQKRIGQQLETVLRGQVVEPYLPFGFSELKADLVVKEIADGEFMIIGDDTVLLAHSLDHPGGCLGFRIENKDAIVTYCTDTAHPDGGLNKNVLTLAKNADLLIHDSQFSLQQREQFPDYGHSSWLEAAQVASEANVKLLALFHHDPDSSDDYLETVLEKARRIFPYTILAYEGLELNLPIVN